MFRNDVSYFFIVFFYDGEDGAGELGKGVIEGGGYLVNLFEG